MFHPARPSGERSCRRVADPFEATNEWDRTVAGFRAEMEALFECRLDDGMSEAEHADAFTQLNTMMQHASDALLDFDSEKPEAKVMERSDFVIELRPKPAPALPWGREPRVVRLYFAEPNLPPDKLVALHLGTKEGDDRRGEQNASIDVATSRAHEWAA